MMSSIPSLVRIWKIRHSSHECILWVVYFPLKQVFVYIISIYMSVLGCYEWTDFAPFHVLFYQLLCEVLERVSLVHTCMFSQILSTLLDVCIKLWDHRAVILWPKCAVTSYSLAHMNSGACEDQGPISQKSW